MANSNWSSQSGATEPYETPENIRSDLATDQIKAFRENPCRGIARLAATATKHDLYIALVLTVRDRLSANRREHLNYGGSNAPASLILSAEFLPGVHPASGELGVRIGSDIFEAREGRAGEEYDHSF